MARDGADRGITLVEVMVATVLTSIVLVTCATLYLGSLRTTKGTQGRLEEINDGRIAISSMGRTLRTAILPSQLFDTTSVETAAFIEATPTSIRFYANIDNANNAIGPSKVTYSVSSGVLSQTVQRPMPVADPTKPVYIYCAPGPGCVVPSKVLARGVVLSGDPIFTYYDALGNKLTGATLTAAQLEVVDSIDISVTVAKSGVGGNGSTYVLRVALPNHDAVVRANEE
jgi:type II secretory pathway pseudopilin PulG